MLTVIEDRPLQPWAASRRAALAVKHAADLAAAALLIVLLSPVMAAVAMAILVLLGRPILFRQLRPGKGGQPFRLLKFRSMAAGSGSDEERLTRLGRLLRATSLDELPALWNVLRNEMSLVGPRPLLMQYLARYTPEQARRHEMKPGITGWAQVHGRNAVAWEDRLRLDVWYVDHWSLLLDLEILGKTVGQVLGRKGIHAPGSATMPEFMGSEGAAPAVGDHIGSANEGRR